MMPQLEQLESRLVPTTLTSHGGPVLSSVALTNIYVGAGWSGFDALGTVAAGPYAALASPYGVGAGFYLGSANLPASGPLSDTGVRTLLMQEIASGAVALPGPNSFYMVCLPQRVTDPSLQQFAAYHNWFLLPTGQAVNYGVVWLQPNASPYYTHEVIEGVTDPHLNGWYGPVGVSQECADLYGGSVLFDGQIVSQFSLPDGSPAVPPPMPAPSPADAPIAPSPITNVFAFALERLRQDIFTLLVRFSPAFQPQSAAATQAVTADPLHGTAQGQMVEMQVDAVFAAWVSEQE